ncbi:hypothetical protein B0H15DRAFT_316495 [Mycena belliarum]|uniref:Uncharacterized protein n=1 Tax=Mycena belliarum TaxID=1033014 RepID=A0AAD6UG06_9AGAR|nr:hypothetical protein B0H15DRAFT_316495 [Mycena belliae]
MGLSAQTTLIVAVASACAGAVVVALVLYRLLRRPAKPAPLPPKQELARYREQHTHAPRSRPPTWYDSGLLSAPPSDTYTSKSSFGDSRGGSPFRHPSLVSESPLCESPSDDSFTNTPMPLPLQLPHLPFDISSTSLSTADTDSPHPSTPLRVGSTDSHSPRHPRSMSSLRPQRRSRPLSVGSGSSRGIRGVPHGPHSQVQIVLPAPLAFGDVSNSSRLSVVDQWAPMAVRSDESLMPRPQRRSFSSSEPRRSTSQSSQSHLSPNSRRAMTSLSAPLPQRSHPPSPDYSSSSPPPVPQIPQQWLPDPLVGIPEYSTRGRSRDLGPSTLTDARAPQPAGERPPQPVDRPPPADEKRKLRKLSRSRA